MINATDLIIRFGEQEIAELSDKNGDYGYQKINDDVINKAILDAESEAESYLNAVGLVSRNANGELIYRHALTAPTALTIRLCDMARYYLYENSMTPVVEQRYKQALDWLKLVMKNPTMLTGISTQTTQSGICVMPNPKPNLWAE